MNAGGHLTSEEVAAYLDNTLSEAECAHVKSHLADCDACRKEVVSVSKLLAGAPRSRRRVIAFSSLAAAAALVFLLVRPSSDSTLPAVAVLRGRDTPAASEGVSGLRAIAPLGRQTTSDGIVFVWHPALPGATYRFTLTDDRGGKVWVGSTNDTTLPLPRQTSLLGNRDYHWYVDVLQPDGSSATTGITSFQVIR
jgi:putative zinc finger protein